MARKLSERLNMERLRFRQTRSSDVPRWILHSDSRECLSDSAVLVGWDILFVIEDSDDPGIAVLTVACTIDEISLSASFWTDTGLDDTELLADSILGSMYKSVFIDGGITKQIIARIFRSFSDYAVRMEIL